MNIHFFWLYLFKSFVRLPFSSYSNSACRSAPSMKLNAPCQNYFF